jgi:hypothetical protein
MTKHDPVYNVKDIPVVKNYMTLFRGPELPVAHGSAYVVSSIMPTETVFDITGSPCTLSPYNLVLEQMTVLGCEEAIE